MNAMNLNENFTKFYAFITASISLEKGCENP